MTHAQLRSLRLALGLVFVLALRCLALAQSPPVTYRLTLDKNPTTHFINVTLQVNGNGAGSLVQESSGE